jgi:hypothetical protein
MRRVAACPGMSCLWQSSPQRKQSDNQVARDATPNVHFRAVSHMFYDAVLLLLSPYLKVMLVYSTRDMKSDLVGKYVCQKVGVSAYLVKHVRGNILSPWLLPSFQLLRNLHLVHIDTQPLSENLMHSCSWHQQFPWSTTNWLPWTSNERHADVWGVLSASSVQSRETCAMLWSSLLLVLLSYKHNETPLHPHNGLKLTTQHLEPSPELTPSLREMTKQPKNVRRNLNSCRRQEILTPEKNASF